MSDARAILLLMGWTIGLDLLGVPRQWIALGGLPLLAYVIWRTTRPNS